MSETPAEEPATPEKAPAEVAADGARVRKKRRARERARTRCVDFSSSVTRSKTERGDGRKGSHGLPVVDGDSIRNRVQAHAEGGH